jgi:putative hemolysin
MAEIAYEIVILILLIAANGVFAMSEMAIVSARKARLQQFADDGDEGARAALALAEAPNVFLSTVQIGITLIGILAGAFGGATLANRVAAAAGQVRWLAPYANEIGIGVVVLLITYLSLVMGELAPKRLALNKAETIAARVARPMYALSRLTAPIVHVLSASTDLLLRAVGARPSSEPPVTEEEIKIMIAQGAEVGVFEKAEKELVTGVFRLAERRVSTLMTPRPEIVWFDIDEPPQEIWRQMAASGHSAFPIYEGVMDNVLGIVNAKDLWARTVAGQPIDLRQMLVPPLFVPESTPALRVLELLRETRRHLALVIDEFGSIQGLVTLFDILEAIVGEIPSAAPWDEPEVVQREDGSWLLDGALPVDEMRELFDLDRLPDQERGAYETLGGFVMMMLGRIPTAGDHFEWEGLRFEVVDMDRLRVDKVLVARAKGEGPKDLSRETGE